MEAWTVDVQEVKKYLGGEGWNDFEWVKNLIDDPEKNYGKKRNRIFSRRDERNRL